MTLSLSLQDVYKCVEILLVSTASGTFMKRTSTETTTQKVVLTCAKKSLKFNVYNKSKTIVNLNQR